MMSYFRYTVYAVLALAGTACHDSTDAPEYEGDYISFSSEIEPRDATTTENIPSFKVSAMTGHDIIMNDVVVTRTGINSWIYSPHVKWPEGKPVDFYAVSPPEVKMQINTSWHHTINYSSTGTEDLLVSVKMQARPTSSRLKLNFRHALAMIKMRARTSRTDVEIRLRSIAVRNVAGHGDFFFPDESTLPGKPIGSITDCWRTYYNGEYFKLFDADGYVTLSDTPIDAGNTGVAFFIPCVLDDVSHDGYIKGSTIEVSYKIVDKETGATIWPDNNTHNQLLDPADRSYGMAHLPLNSEVPGKRLESGKSYNYLIDVDNPASLPQSRTASTAVNATLTVTDF
ncbi:MAG: fimbrillin family protein [Bacteroides sp.]|nr:fimbrillin family protein [Bacteroides sp.]MCM1389018.1 fimbrillin family protein [Bacteroides sp.]